MKGLKYLFAATVIYTCGYFISDSFLCGWLAMIVYNIVALLIIDEEDK